MKLFIASDIHGSATYCRTLFQRWQEEGGRILLLGDLLYHGPRNDLPQGYAPKEVIALLNAEKENIIAVRGNCEAEVDQMVLEFPCMADFSTLTLEDGRLLFATHGHIFNAENMPPLPMGSVLMHGHTHIKNLQEVGGCFVLNPGSVSIPKDGERSYLTYENGVFQFKALDSGEVLSVFHLPPLAGV